MPARSATGGVISQTARRTESLLIPTAYAPVPAGSNPLRSKSCPAPDPSVFPDLIVGLGLVPGGLGVQRLASRRTERLGTAHAH